jgi:hypothetical protein
MKFSLVFENNEEGVGSSYDLLFAPCPVFAQGENWVLNLNPDNPHLQPGSVQRLLEQENLEHVKKCVIVVHSGGHGDIESLELLKKDLDNANLIYRVIDFGELK